MNRTDSNIYIGSAGWSYPDWQGIVYPKNKPPGFSELEFYSQYFNLVEINSSFYKIPSEKTVEKWQATAKKTNPQFKFLIKLWNKFTHAAPFIERDKVDQFNKAFSCLKKNEIGGLLVQFPWSYKYDKKNLLYILDIAEAFSEYHICAELRHGSWDNNTVLEQFKKKQITFVNIDQPIIGNSLKRTKHITSPVGYLRLHGRNENAWFNEQSGRDARYNYLYSKQELDEWYEYITSSSKNFEQYFVVFNNHFRGQALINAFQMHNKLLNEKPLCPKTLWDFSREIKDVAVPDDHGQTISLF